MLQRACSLATAFILTAAVYAAAPKPPIDSYPERVREIVDRDTQHCFRVVSVQKTDQETHVDEGVAKVRFKGEAELIRDAYGRAQGSAFLGLSAYSETIPSDIRGRPGSGVVYAKWSKGARVPIEGSIAWDRSDEGWRVSPMTMVHQPPFSRGPAPDEYVIRCFHEDGPVDHHSAKPYVELLPPSSEECSMVIAAELAKSNFGQFLRAENVVAAFPATNGALGGLGGEYLSAPITFRGVFKIPAVFMGGFFGFIPAPVVGGTVTISARDVDFESFGQYFEPGESVQCETTLIVTREWDYDRWKFDVLQIKLPEVRSAKGVRVKYAQSGNQVVYRSVETFPR